MSKQATSQAKQTAQTAEQLGMGKVSSNSHPLHPATVHFPIAFLSLSYLLDILFAYSKIGPFRSTLAKLWSSSPYLSEISIVSYHLNALGILTSVPAVLTGSAELFAMIQGNGIWEVITREKDGETVYSGINPKVRHGILHALLNDVALLASVFNWWTRRGRKDYALDNVNVWLSGAMLPAMMFSAYLGGAMVYKYGVGVMRQGEAVQIKEDMQKDEMKKREGWTIYKVRKE